MDKRYINALFNFNKKKKDRERQMQRKAYGTIIKQGDYRIGLGKRGKELGRSVRKKEGEGEI